MTVGHEGTPPRAADSSMHEICALSQAFLCGRVRGNDWGQVHGCGAHASLHFYFNPKPRHLNPKP